MKTSNKIILVILLMASLSSCTDLLTSMDEGTGSKKTYHYSYETQEEDYSWIVGTWACDMGAYGTVVIQFEGDGSSGNCTEAQYGSYKSGTYHVSGNTLRYKLSGESVTTTIEIESGHRLSAGGGYYYHKR